MKVDIISGFLGAGKTTVIKKLFTSTLKKEKVVLIENEFGEIGIDGAFLKESGVNIKEINSGCICCSLVGDFATSLKEVINQFNPERIIIEPSGVGKLSDIAKAIKNVDAPLELNILATVVDGPKCKVYMKNFGEFFDDQVETADTIIISKTDKMTSEKLEEVVQLLKNENNHANIITTSINMLDGVQLLNILEEKVSLKEQMLAELVKAHQDEDEHHCCHHHDDEEEHEHECCHHHDDEDEHEHECCHHHDDEEHEYCHHHDEDEHECCHHHEHDSHHEHHHADEVFTSWGLETTRTISHQGLVNFLEDLKNNESLGIILRAKGILKANDNESWYYFDFVAGDYEIRLGNPDYTGRLCVIGSNINSKKINESFDQRG